MLCKNIYYYYWKNQLPYIEKDQINNSKWLSMVDLGLEILSNFILSLFWIFQHFFIWICKTSVSRFFFYFIFKLYNIVLVLPYIEMNPPQAYTCSPSWTPLPTPHTILLGRPSAPAPSIQYRASHLDWWLVSYMILYIFQCHSPKSSHPLPLPQSPKDCSIHQCLFCCLVHRVIVTIFLNSTYMR